MAGSLVDGVSNVLHGIFQSLLALLQLPIDVLSAIFKMVADVVGHIGAVIFCESYLGHGHLKGWHLNHLFKLLLANLMVIGVVVAAIYILNNTRQGQQIKKKAS